MKYDNLSQEARIYMYRDLLNEALICLDENQDDTLYAIRLSKNATKGALQVLGKIGSLPKRKKAA